MSTDTIETSVGSADVFHRLALAVLPRDAVRSRDGVTYSAAVGPLRVGWEAPERLLPRDHPVWWPCLDLEPVGSGGYRLRATKTLIPRNAPVTLRVYDPLRRHVPRRLSLTPWPWEALTDPTRNIAVSARTLPVWLTPGVAYPLPRGATAVRGRIVRPGGDVVPWARVTGLGAGGTVLGRTHSDDRGEFLLVLTTTDQNPVQSTVGVDLQVRAPRAADTPPPDDPPVEPVLRPSDPPFPAELDNPLVRGETSPADYVVGTTAFHRAVGVGRELVLLSDVPFTAP